MRTIDNPVAIVTGAAQGLGKAIAKRLADEGCRVSITDKNSEVVVAGEEIGAESYVGNVGEARHVRQVVDSVLKIYGKIDILINNAGEVFPTGPRDDWDTTDEMFDRVFSLSLIHI